MQVTPFLNRDTTEGMMKMQRKLQKDLLKKCNQAQ